MDSPLPSGTRTLSAYAHLLRRNFALIAALAACGCLIGGAITYAKGAVFLATVTIAVDEVPAGYNTPVFASRARTLDTDAALVVADDTLAAALDSANSAESVTSLRDRIVITAVAESNVLVVTVEDDQPESATAMATAVAGAFINSRRAEYDLALRRSMATLRSYYDIVWRGIVRGMRGVGADPTVKAVVKRSTRSNLSALNTLLSALSSRPPPEDRPLRLSAPQTSNRHYPGVSQQLAAGGGTGFLLAWLLIWLRDDGQVPPRHLGRAPARA